MNRAALVTLIVALHVILQPIVFGVVFPFSMSVLEVSAYLALLVAISSRRLPRGYLVAMLWLVLGFGLHVAVLGGDVGALGFRGTCVSGDSGVTGLDTVAALDSFRRGLACFIIFLLVLELSSSTQHFRWLVGAVALSGAILLLLGLVAPRDSQSILWSYAVPTHDRYWLSATVDRMLSSMFGYQRPYSFDGVPLLLDELQVSSRPVGSVFNENQFASALGVTLPVLLGWIIAQWGRTAVMGRGLAAVVMAAGMCAVSLFFTGSRAGLIAQIVSLAGFFVVLHRPHAVRLYAGVVAILVMSVCLLVPLVQASGIATLGEDRAAIWLQTANLFVANPLGGIGLGNFPYAGVGIDGEPFSPWYSAHNVYLQLLAEVGLGGVTWLAVTGTFLQLHWKRVQIRQRIGGPLAAGLFASLIFAITHAAFDYSPSMPFNAVIVSVVAGLLLGSKRAVTPERSDARNQLAFSAATALGLIMVTWLIATSMRYSFAEVRLADTRDLTARVLSRTGDKDQLLRRLAETRSEDERFCRLIPPRKDHLLAMAHAHVLLSRLDREVNLVKASAFMGRYQATGPYDPRRLPTQLEIDQRLTGLDD